MTAARNYMPISIPTMNTPSLLLNSFFSSESSLGVSQLLAVDSTALKGLMNGDTLVDKMRFMSNIPEPSTYGIFIGVLLLAVVVIKRQKKISR